MLYAFDSLLVLIKSMISTNLVKERPSIRLFGKSLRNNVEALREMEVAFIKELNKRQGVSLSSSQGTTSEIENEEIFIAPNCHQEDHGIVVWFWCQSKNAQRHLQSMYSSGTLLGKLLTIFKEFSNGSVSSGSQLGLPVPTGITIYADDFKKNKSKFHVFL